MSNRSSAHVGVSEGAMVTRIYWTVPTPYTVGEEFESRTEALRAAIAGAQRTVELITLAPEWVIFDERWKFKNLDGSTVDTVIERTTYDTLAEAKRMLGYAELYGAP